jgi:hypothetical protein
MEFVCFVPKDLNCTKYSKGMLAIYHKFPLRFGDKTETYT